MGRRLEYEVKTSVRLNMSNPQHVKINDIDDIKEEVIEAATNEARKEVIRLLGGVISGMNVGQPVIMQAANSEAQEPTEDVMDDADVAGLAMGWMSKGD